MQFAVAGFRYVDYKKRKRSKIFLITFFVVVIIFICVILITNLIIQNSSHNNYINSRNIFYISLFESENIKEIKNLQSKTRSLGGAGYIYSQNNRNYVLMFACLSKQDAEKIKNKNAEYSESIKIIERSASKIKFSVRRKIISDQYLNEGLKFLYNLGATLFDLSVSFDSGGISQSQVYKDLVKYTLLCQDFLRKYESFDDKVTNIDIYKQFITTYKILNEALESCKNEIYRGGETTVYIKYLIISVFEIDIDLRKELNKIK